MKTKMDYVYQNNFTTMLSMTPEQFMTNVDPLFYDWLASEQGVVTDYADRKRKQPFCFCKDDEEDYTDWNLRLKRYDMRMADFYGKCPYSNIEFSDTGFTVKSLYSLSKNKLKDLGIHNHMTPIKKRLFGCMCSEHYIYPNKMIGSRPGKDFFFVTYCDNYAYAEKPDLIYYDKPITDDVVVTYVSVPSYHYQKTHAIMSGNEINVRELLDFDTTLTDDSDQGGHHIYNLRRNRIGKFYYEMKRDCIASRLYYRIMKGQQFNGYSEMWEQQMGMLDNFFKVEISEDSRKYVDDKIEELKTLAESNSERIADGAMTLTDQLARKDPIKVQIGLENNYAVLLAELTSLGYAIWKAKDYAHLASIVTVYLMGKRVATQLIYDFLDLLKKTFSKAEQESEDETVDKAGFCLFNGISAIFTGSLKTMKEYVNVFRNATIFERGIRSFKTMVDWLLNVLKKSLNWVYYQVTGVNLFDQETEDGLSKWLKESQDILTPAGRANPDSEAVLEKISDLMTQGWAINSVIKDNPREQEFKTTFTNLRLLSVKSRHIQEEARTMPAPFLVYLYGRTGLRKTTNIMKLASKFVQYDPTIETEAERIEILENMDKYIYYRAPENIYNDGLKARHFIVAHDDAFQNVDSQARPNPEMLELIRGVGPAPQLPHMADVEEKGRFQMRTRLIICTSNVAYPNPIESISKPSALHRRISTFRHKVTSDPDQPFRCQRTHKTERGEARLEGPVMDFDTYVDEFVVEVRKWFADQKQYAEDIKDYTKDIVDEVRKSASYKLEIEKKNVIAQQQIGESYVSRDFYEGYVDWLIDNSGTLELSHSSNAPEFIKDIFRVATDDNIKNKKTKLEIVFMKLALTENQIITLSEHSSYKAYLEWRSTRDNIDKKTRLALLKHRLQKFNDERPWLANVTKALAVAISLGASYWIVKNVAPVVYNWAKKVLIKIKNWFVESGEYLRASMMSIVEVGNKKFVRLIRSIRNSFKSEDVLYDAKEYFSDSDIAKIEEVGKRIATGSLEDVHIHDANFVQQKDTVQFRPGRRIKEFSRITQELANYDVEQDKANRRNNPRMAAHLTQEFLDDAGMNTALTKIEQSMFYIKFVEQKTIEPKGVFLGLTADKFLAFGHALHAINAKGSFVMNHSGVDVVVDNDQIEVCVLPNDETEGFEMPNIMSIQQYCEYHIDNMKNLRDAVVIKIKNKNLPTAPTVMKQICTSKDRLQIMGGKGVLINNNSAASKLYNTVGPFKMNEKPIYTEGRATYRMVDSIMYSAITHKGSCGSPLILQNPRVQGRLIGIHVAALSDGINGCMAVSIYKELLEDAINRLDSGKDVTNVNDLQMQEMGLEMDEEFVTSEARELGDGMFVFGRVSNPVYLQKDTKLKKSLIHGEAFPSTMEPTMLEPYIDEGQVIDPMMRGLEGFRGQNGELDDGYVKSVVSSVFDHIYQRSEHKCEQYDRVFTLEEAVFGLPDDPAFKPIDRTTSGGRTWDSKGCKGKSYYIRGEIGSKTNPPFIHEDLRKKVNERLEKAKQGIRKQTIYQDTLKPEKKKRKTDPMYSTKPKTRVFSNGQLDYNLLVRMYFGGFILWFIKNMIANTSLVGINMYSATVNYLAKSLASSGGVLAGDFENYDKRLRADIGRIILSHFIEPFYKKATKEERMVRLVLFCDLMRSLHITGDILYMLVKSIPSGHPLTTIFNSLYNLIAAVLVYLMVVPIWYRTVALFFKLVVCYFYGDDNIFGVDKSIIQYFNYKTLVEAYLKIGMIYTDSSKQHMDGVKLYDKLEDVTILKRYFRFDYRMGRYVACLDKSVIEEMVNWVHDTLDEKVALYLNINVATREAALWDFEYYDNFTLKINAALRSRGLEIVPVEPYGLLRQQVLVEYMY